MGKIAKGGKVGKKRSVVLNGFGYRRTEKINDDCFGLMVDPSASLDDWYLEFTKDELLHGHPDEGVNVAENEVVDQVGVVEVAAPIAARPSNLLC
jgi:hypothetical protein